MEINTYIHSLIQRAARHSGLQLCQGEAFELSYTKRKNYWLASILERLKECGLQLAMGGTSVIGSTQDEILSTFNTKKRLLTNIVFTNPQIKLLIQLRIQTIGDLLIESTEGRCWMPAEVLSQMKISFLLPWLKNVSIPNGPILLGQQTCWLDNKKKRILEYLGRVTDSSRCLMFREWIPVNSELPISCSTLLKLSEATPSKVAGTDLTLTYEEVWPVVQLQAVKCILTSDQTYILNDQLTITRKVKNLSTTSKPYLGSVKDIINSTSTLDIATSDMRKRDFQQGNFTIYTDGSHRDNTPFIHKTLYGTDTNLHIATGGICIISNEQVPYGQRNIITIHLSNQNGLPLLSAYPVEVLAMIVAHHIAQVIQPQQICTDCNSIADLLCKRKKQMKVLLKNYSTLIQHLLHITSIQKVPIIHQYSHINTVIKEEDMTEAEWGNALVDRVADNDMEYVNSRCFKHSHHTVDLADFIEIDIKQQLQLHLVEGDHIFLTALKDKMQSTTFKAYVQQRIKHSTLNDHWTTTTYELANQAWNLDIGNLSQRSSSIRIIFDKLWQPWNIKKYKKEKDLTHANEESQESIAEDCNFICHNCNKQLDSLEHLICYCDNVLIVGLRNEGKDDRRILRTQANNCPLTTIVYDIIESMLTSQQNPVFLYISLWSTLQYQYFLHEIQVQTGNLINLHNLSNQNIIQQAIINYSRLLTCSAQQLVSQRLRFNKASTKRYGPPTQQQFKHEQRRHNTWSNYEARTLLRKKKKEE